MMKVYLLIDSWQEGWIILGIYATEEAANLALKNDDGGQRESLSIEEWEVLEKAEENE